MTNYPELEVQLRSVRFAASSDEMLTRDRMLELLAHAPNCFLRSCFPAHFTGSALVLSADFQRTLLHHHRKLDRWLQFGGHCDGEADVLAVARREAHEESGIDSLAVWNSQPFDLDIHKIPARGEEPAHWHYDVRYLFVAPHEAIFQQSAESRELRWFTPEEMEALPLDTGLRRLVAKWRNLIASQN
ncbi:MAG: NUDIX hydrolase [Verrucomicrobiota bacterium]|nr:NUDIX hydrolase [Verrucomicrobiota bacterium]